MCALLCAGSSQVPAVVAADTMPPMAEAVKPMPPPMDPTPLQIEETRDASGTAWQPDSTPMFMWMTKASGWMLGLHTNSFVGYDSDAGSGDDQPSAST